MFNVKINLNDLRTKVDWQTIINVGNSLSMFNDRQSLMKKAEIIERTIDCNNSIGIKYVAEIGHDFICESWNNAKIELKSQFSSALSIYTKEDRMRLTYGAILKHGRGKIAHIQTEESTPEILILLRRDGALVVTKDIILKRSYVSINDIHISVPWSEVVQITGNMTPTEDYTAYFTRLKEEEMHGYMNIPKREIVQL